MFEWDRVGKEIFTTAVVRFFGVGMEKEIIPMRSEKNSVKPSGSILPLKETPEFSPWEGDHHILETSTLHSLNVICPFFIGNTSSFRVHFPASYVRLPVPCFCFLGCLFSGPGCLFSSPPGFFFCKFLWSGGISQKKYQFAKCHWHPGHLPRSCTFPETNSSHLTRWWVPKGNDHFPHPFSGANS